MTTSILRAGKHKRTADQRIVLYGVPWDHYESQLAMRGDASVPRFAYDQGALELMSPSKDHERIKSCIGCLVMTYALERGIDLSPYGSWTLKSAPKGAGAEPDECYIVGQDQAREVPDLVIEVAWTAGGLDKLEIYRRLGIGEVWLWRDGRIGIHVLRRGSYGRVRRSTVLPDLDVELLASFLDHPTTVQAVQAFRRALRHSSPSVRRPRR